MDRQSIKSLNDRDNVDSVFLVKEKHVGVGKNGRLFLAAVFGDSTGSLDARAWDRVEELASLFQIGDLVSVKGTVQLFQERKQILVHRIEKKDDSEFSVEDFLEHSLQNPQDMFVELVQLVKTIKSQPIQQLVLSSLEDPEIRSRLLRAPAAKSVHHAWIGGLLEHVLSMSRLMVSLSSAYPFLNRDLLIFGAIFHDLGKIWELNFQHNISYSDAGRLLGHMQLACELIDQKSQKILGFPDELRVILKHIILAHHGKLEFGSPKRPKFLEAAVLAMVDDLDSKVSSIHHFIESEKKSMAEVQEKIQEKNGSTQASGLKWSKYNELYDRYFLLEDLSEKYR